MQCTHRESFQISPGKGIRRFDTRGREDAEAEALAKLLLILGWDDRGQDTAEYGIALAVIGLAAGLAAILIAQNVGTLWSRANSLVQIAVDNP